MAFADTVDSLKWFCNRWTSSTLRDGLSPVWQRRVQVFRKAGEPPYLISNTGSSASAISFPNSGSIEITYIDRISHILDSHLNQTLRVVQLIKNGCSVQLLAGDTEWNAVTAGKYGGALAWNTSAARHRYEGFLLRIGNIQDEVLETLISQLLYISIPESESIIHEDPKIGQLFDYKSALAGHVFFRHSLVNVQEGPLSLRCGINLFHENPGNWSGKWGVVLEGMLGLWDAALKTAPSKISLLYDQINSQESFYEADYIAKHPVITRHLSSYFKERHGEMCYPWPRNVPKPASDRKYQLVTVSPDLFRILKQDLGTYEEHMGSIFQRSRSADMTRHVLIEDLLNTLLRGNLGIDGFIFKYIPAHHPRCLVVGQVCYLHARLLTHPGGCHETTCPGWLSCIVGNILQAICTELGVESPNFNHIAKRVLNAEVEGQVFGGHEDEHVGIGYFLGNPPKRRRIDEMVDTDVDHGDDDETNGDNLHDDAGDAGDDDGNKINNGNGLESDKRDIILVYTQGGKVQSEDLIARPGNGSGWGFFQKGDILHIEESILNSTFYFQHSDPPGLYYNTSGAPRDVGNSILVNIHDMEYVYIGDQIKRFFTNEIVLRYMSPVGNDAVSYPFPVTKNLIYQMIEDAVVDNAAYV
ncbi:hypothetical protein DFJ77DRAFT_511652 [Powellomyces hirtus]|nr:hypothetical protein DFJ77DRAFT_511652 [Powellomyces hirtus]